MIRGGAYSLSGRALRELAADDEGEHISVDHAVKGLMDYAEPTVNANIAYSAGDNGTGITVAVYLTLWPQGTTQPVVANLNDTDGTITGNMAVVPTSNGSISAFVTNPTQLVLDIFGYFAP